MNHLWHSAPIGCTSLLNTNTFIICLHGSSSLLSSFLSQGLIDISAYACDLCNRWLAIFRLALECPQPNMRNRCIFIHCTNAEKMLISNGNSSNKQQQQKKYRSALFFSKTMWHFTNKIMKMYFFELTWWEAQTQLQIMQPRFKASWLLEYKVGSGIWGPVEGRGEVCSCCDFRAMPQSVVLMLMHLSAVRACMEECVGERMGWVGG